MLAELHITNFVLIDELHMSFQDGLTVFTGETGAGKSIIIDAIALLAGARGSADFVRHGARKAEIEALFDSGETDELAAILDHLGLGEPGEQIILRREISSSGKSICRVNGKMVTLSILQQIGAFLIDIHGQHDHQRLLDPASHILFVDRFGGSALSELKKDYAAYYHHVAEIVNKYDRYNRDERELAQRADLLRYQINEIESARLHRGEEEQLIEEKNRLVHFEKIFQTLKSVYGALNGDHAVLDSLRAAAGELGHVRDFDPQLAHFADSVDNGYYLLEEQASAVRDYLEQMDYDPDKLDAIEARLSDLYSLKRKYGNTVEDVLDYYEQIKKELGEISTRDEQRDALKAALNAGMNDLYGKARRLSEARKKAARRLSEAINRELNDLCMADACLDVHFEDTGNGKSFSAFTREGIDHVAFFMTTNPGEPAKPLAKIASGGELSRIMLAIKTVLRKVMNPATILLDEADTGVSGKAAQAIAEKISHLAQSTQIFVITHLPQVAAMADHHLLIEKRMTGKQRTETKVKKLNQAAKIREISRMISGPQMTSLALEHAEELLRMAEQLKSS